MAFVVTPAIISCARYVAPIAFSLFFLGLLKYKLYMLEKAAIEEINMREAYTQERARAAAARQQWMTEETQSIARPREALQEAGERERGQEIEEILEQLRVINEKLDKEKCERLENERKNEIKVKNLASQMQMFVDALRLYNDIHLHQQMHNSSHHTDPRLEYHERAKLLALFELPQDSDEDLHNIFHGAYLGNPCHQLEIAESSGHPNRARNIEDDDILCLENLVIKTIESQKNSPHITILELHNELFGGFEDDAENSAIISMDNAEGNRAKEEGNAYFKELKFEEAIECYSKSINEVPTAAGYGNRAMAYIKTNKFIEAEQDCTDALNIDDRYFKAYARRAMARTKLGGNLEGALEDVKVALELESNNLEMKELYSEISSLKAATEAKEEGNNLFKDQNFEEAIICYTVSINKSPTAVAYSNRAMAYLKLDKLIEAENDCTDALKIDDQFFKAYARRAIARTKFGRNFKGAFEDVEAALNLEPNNQEMKELHAKLNEVLGSGAKPGFFIRGSEFLKAKLFKK